MVVLYFILGLVLGSFYNVCIYRLPLEKSVVTPRSSCGSCGHVLGGLDMIPVVSFLIFKGKCRHCGASYSARYMLIELLTGLLFAITYLVFGFTWLSVIGIVLSSIVIIVTFIDIDHHIILDRFSVFTMIIAVIYHYFYGDISWLNIGLGFLIGGGVLLLISFIGTMGGGDIKIMASLGLLLGYPKIIMAFYFSFVLGAVILLPIMIYSKIKHGEYKSLVPFGPFLCLGAWLTFYFGDVIFNAYLELLF